MTLHAAPRTLLVAFFLAVNPFVCPTAPGGTAIFGPASLMLQQTAGADAPDPAASNPEAADSDDALPAPRISFGNAGAWYWTVGGGAAFHGDSTDAQANAGLGVFLTDHFEFNFGLAGWYFFQEGEDTGGGNPNFAFRYHFSPKDPFNLYIEAGIGLLFTGDDVPEDGESFNFTPRAGVGTLWKLPDSELRLDVGLRWHHISTASTTGSDDNPSRDSIMVYAGIVVPF